MSTAPTPLTKDDLQALLDTGRELAGEVGLEALLERILQVASRLTDSPDTSVILKNDYQDTLYIAAATGDQSEWVLSTFGIHSEKQIPVSGSKAGDVFRNRQSLIENRVSDHFKGVDAETNSITQSMVCVPLAAGDECHGVMQVLNKRSGAYEARDQMLLEHLAVQAAIALRNARLVESLLAHSGLYAACEQTSDMLARMRMLREEAQAEVLSVLFADMRGFTQLCQSLIDPARVQQHLSEFIAMLSDAVLEYDGIVNKFLGDGVMALFRGERHAQRAVESAFKMLTEFDRMLCRWNEHSNQQLDFLDLGVGIVTDRVIVGGIGSGQVRDFTAIGTAVNLAAALEKEARDGCRVLCDQFTYTNVKDMVAHAENLPDFILQKPGQTVGVKYKRYHLRALGSAAHTQVFVSHSHLDRDYVQANIVQPLGKLGIGTWYSADDIPKGALWTAEIRKALSASNWMVVIVSQNSVASKWVRREVDLAVAASHLDERIIPIVLDEANPKDLNEFLSAMQGIDVREQPQVAELLATQLRGA